MIRLLRTYILWNGEFGSALAKRRNFGGGWNPPPPPFSMPLLIMMSNFLLRTYIIITFTKWYECDSTNTCFGKIQWIKKLVCPLCSPKTNNHTNKKNSGIRKEKLNTAIQIPPFNIIMSQFQPHPAFTSYVPHTHLKFISRFDSQTCNRTFPKTLIYNNSACITCLPHPCHISKPSKSPSFHYSNNAKWPVQAT
jgi:hypothetical protein